MEKTESIKTLLEVYDEELVRLESRIGKDRSINTLKAMRQGRNHIATYLVRKLKKNDLPLKEVMPQLISDFSVYLSTECGLRMGTVWLTCLQLKGVVTRAHQRGLLSWNPFAGFHIAKKIRPRQYLTEEELERLMTHHFKTRSLNFARDIFVFSAFTGLSFVDICELRPSDIMEIGDAVWIVSKRYKTKIPYQVKMLEIPLQILRHYQQYAQEWIFGPITYRNFANNINKVMAETGIRKGITMHCARHTFAVLAINNGMPIESLSRILGHANIATTQIYAKITMQKIDADMTELEKRLGVIRKLHQSCIFSEMQ